MSLSEWDKAIIERLAYTYRSRGKEPSKRAYNKLALANGWHGTSMWIEGRTLFKDYWMSHRKAFNESFVGQNGVES